MNKLTQAMLAIGFFLGLGISVAQGGAGAVQIASSPGPSSNITVNTVAAQTGNFTFIDAGSALIGSASINTNMALTGNLTLNSSKILGVDGVTGTRYILNNASNNLELGVVGGSASGSLIAQGALFVSTTAVGNVGASAPDDLISYSLPASAVNSTGRGVRITAWGTCANNANAKTFTLNFGSQVVLTHACTASVAGEVWRIVTLVHRTGASTQDWTSIYEGSTGVAGAFEFDPELGTATQTESGAIVIKMQTTVSTSDNDIVQEGMRVDYL